jgi:hypothetical protein
MMKYFAGKTADRGKTEYYFHFVVNGSIALMQHWLKNNMDIPIPEIAEMLIKFTPWTG